MKFQSGSSGPGKGVLFFLFGIFLACRDNLLSLLVASGQENMGIWTQWTRSQFWNSPTMQFQSRSIFCFKKYCFLFSRQHSNTPPHDEPMHLSRQAQLAPLGASGEAKKFQKCSPTFWPSARGRKSFLLHFPQGQFVHNHFRASLGQLPCHPPIQATHRSCSIV